MISKLKLDWTATLMVEDFLAPCKYNAVLSFEAKPDLEWEEIDIAISRCNQIADLLNGSIIIAETHEHLAAIGKMVGNTLVTLGEAPADIVIATSLLSKLMLVVEQRLDILGLEIICDHSEDTATYMPAEELASYLETLESPMAANQNKPGWWARNDMSMNNMPCDVPLWDEVGLDWPKAPRAAPKKKQNNWKPTVIEGGAVLEENEA